MQTGKSMGAAIGTLIVATGIIQLANGFFTTFLSLRVALEAFDVTVAGLVLSSYFAGFTVAAVRSDRIIVRIGHIRAYAAFAGAVAAATAAMPLLVDAYAWMGLRAVIGFGCAGIFVTTESWLNAKAPTALRGRVFAIYMVATFLALAIGQLLIGQVDVRTAAPFSAIVTLFALGLVLVSATRAEAPRAAAVEAPPYGALLRAAPAAVVGCALSGVITGTFYALVPAWMQGAAIDQETIALVMFAAVLGGLVFQVPVGRMSDRLERRGVLIALGIGLVGVVAVLVLLPRTLAAVLPAAALLGGFMSTLYPVAVAHAHDRMPADRVVAVSGALILASGCGSVLGPLIGVQVMARLGIDGVLYFMAATALLLVLLVAARRGVRKGEDHLDRTFEILTPQAAPLAHDPGDAELPAAPEEQPAAAAPEAEQAAAPGAIQEEPSPGGRTTAQPAVRAP